MLDLSYSQLIVVTTVAFCAATVQASVGIGFAMIAVPLLALVDIAFVPGATLLASLVLVVLITVDGYEHVEYSDLPSSLSGILLGSVAGGLGLVLIDAAYLSRLFGAVILIAVVLSILGLSVENSVRARVLVGWVSGVMGTMAGIHGPPFALLYQNEEEKTLRPTLSLLFSVGYAVSLLTLFVLQAINARVLMLALVLIPSVLLGFVTSKVISSRMNKALLRTGILTVAGFSGILLMVRS